MIQWFKFFAAMNRDLFLLPYKNQSLKITDPSSLDPTMPNFSGSFLDVTNSTLNPDTDKHYTSPPPLGAQDH